MTTLLSHEDVICSCATVRAAARGTQQLTNQISVAQLDIRLDVF